MDPQMRWPRPLTGLGLVLSATLLAACAGAGVGPSAGAGESGLSEPSMAPESAAAAGTPAPTDMLVTSINVLPTPSFDPKKVSVACDSATMGTSASMSCDDITALAVRIAATMSRSTPTQVAVTAPADNPSAIQITFWV